MMIKQLALGILCAGVSIVAATLSANATIVNFDDLAGNNSAISPGFAPYQGFVWTNLNVTDGTLGPVPGNTGVGVVSPHNVAANSNGFAATLFRPGADVNTDADQFDLFSFYVTAYQQQAPFDLFVFGFDNLGIKISALITPNNLSPTLIILNWTGVDQVNFIPVQPGNQNKAVKGFFTLDDVDLRVPQVSPVPLPAAMPLLLGGLGMLLAFGKARRRKG